MFSNSGKFWKTIRTVSLRGVANPDGNKDLSMAVKSPKGDVGEIAGIDAFPSREPRPGNPSAMSVNLENGCDDDPEFPLVAAFVKTGHAMDETLDLKALKAVWR